MGGLLRAVSTLSKLMRKAPKKLSPVKGSKKSFPKQKPSSQKDCPKEAPPKKQGGPLSQQSKQELEKSKKSQEALIKEHQKKIEDYKADPYAHDNKGVLKNAPPEHRKSIIEGRIKALEGQLKKQQGELKKIEETLRKFQ